MENRLSEQANTQKIADLQEKLEISLKNYDKDTTHLKEKLAKKKLMLKETSESLKQENQEKLRTLHSST